MNETLQICGGRLSRPKNENEKMKKRQKPDRKTKFSSVGCLSEGQQ